MHFQTIFECGRYVVRFNGRQYRIYLMKEAPVFDHGLNFPACLEHNFGDHKGKLKGLIQM